MDTFISYIIPIKNKDSYVYADKHLAEYLDVSQRTLNRYVNELKEKGKIKATLTTLKNSGRGYLIEKIISKKKKQPKKV